MLAFKLSGPEYFHHLLFIPTLGFPGQLFDWGAVGNLQAFFISGLPGGLDYFFLSIGMQKLRQKQISVRETAGLRWCLRTKATPDGAVGSVTADVARSVRWFASLLTSYVAVCCVFRQTSTSGAACPGC